MSNCFGSFINRITSLFTYSIFTVSIFCEMAEKERIEKILQTKKKLIARIASKLTSRIRRIENDRLSR
jgi:hypothetical protein